MMIKQAFLELSLNLGFSKQAKIFISMVMLTFLTLYAYFKRLSSDPMHVFIFMFQIFRYILNL